LQFIIKTIRISLLLTFAHGLSVVLILFLTRKSFAVSCNELFLYASNVLM